MSDAVKISRTARNAADAATANPNGTEGLVYLTSAADPLAAHLPAAAEVAAPGTIANRPLGVAEYGQNLTGGRVTVVAHGPCDAIAGAAGIAAGSRLVTYDATGALVAFTSAVAGTNQWSVGEIMTDLGDTAIAAGAKFRMFVNPQLIQGVA